jgi:hypothetical protein
MKYRRQREEQRRGIDDLYSLLPLCRSKAYLTQGTNGPTHGPLECDAAHLSVCDTYDHSVFTIDFRLYEAVVEASSVKVAKIASDAFPPKLASLVLGRVCIADPRKLSRWIR